MITVLMLVISTVSYTFSTLANANQKVTQDITDFSRGTYDILIRPAGAQTDLEKRLNLIEENYLGTGDGGITIDEWQTIKNHPKVEVAAPVASIGLFNARKRTWMIKKDEEDPKYFEVEYRTSDGANTYSTIENPYVYDFGNRIREFLIYPSSRDIANNYFAGDKATFNFPNTYHQVVAVDPEEEGKLTDYDFSPLAEQVSDYDTYKDGEFSVPIMSLADVSVPVTIGLESDELADVSAEELVTWESKFINGNPSLTLSEDPARYYSVLEEYVSKKRMHQGEIFEFVPDAGHSPFEQSLLYVDDDMKLTLEGNEFIDGIGGAFDHHSQRIGYRLDPVVYEMKDDQSLLVRQIGVDELYEAPIYRNIEEVEFYEIDEFNDALNDDEFIGFIENGTYSIEKNAEALASAPLGIYGREMPHLAADRSIKLYPSAIPGSFITTPAHGLVSIEWAEKAKGAEPIDAIRVKIAGLTGYDKAAASLIRELAAEWEDKGFTVDIVAGASLQNIVVDVEGIGEVVQPFTSLGAADTVLSSWNVLQVVLTVLYGLVSLTFIGFTFFNLLADRQKDEELLARLGWEQRLIRRIRYKEWAWMLGIPILLVIAGFSLFGLLRDQWLPLLLSIVVSGIYILLFIFADLSQKKGLQQPKKRGKAVAIQNIWFYRFSLLASCIQLFLTTVLTCFLPFFLLQNVARTTQTRLGSYVHGEIEGLFIVIIVLLYVLSLTTVYQSLSRMWKKRAPEIQLFLYLGWGAKAIRTYFLKEILLWAGLSILVGWGVSLAITLVMVEITSTILFLGIIGFVLILVVTLGGSIYSLHREQGKGAGHIAY